MSRRPSLRAQLRDALERGAVLESMNETLRTMVRETVEACDAERRRLKAWLAVSTTAHIAWIVWAVWPG